MQAIQVQNLSKTFGKNRVLAGVAFEVQENEIFGLIGPNGAGKTTTLRTIATLLTIESGTVRIYEYELPQAATEVRKLISYLPEDAGAYKALTGRGYLEFVASFFATGERAKNLVQRGIEIAAIGDRISDKVETYSKGMARRLLVASALMVKPRLAILDEPSSGLDVVNAREVRRIITDAAHAGLSVLLSSHNMLEVELICHRVALINKGRIIASGTPQELKSRYNVMNLEEVFVRAINDA